MYQELKETGSQIDSVNFMEESIRSATQCSEGLATANNKLSDILIRLRGNTPSPISSEAKSKEPVGNMEKLKQQFNVQSIMLNYLHNQLDELSKYF
jgi:hypothetical protein